MPQDYKSKMLTTNHKQPVRLKPQPTNNSLFLFLYFLYLSLSPGSFEKSLLTTSVWHFKSISCSNKLLRFSICLRLSFNRSDFFSSPHRYSCNQPQSRMDQAVPAKGWEPGHDPVASDLRPFRPGHLHPGGSNFRKVATRSFLSKP